MSAETGNGAAAPSAALQRPQFLPIPIDPSKFPAAPVEPRVAKRQVEVCMTHRPSAGHCRPLPLPVTRPTLVRCTDEPTCRTRNRARLTAVLHQLTQGLRNLDATPRLNLASFVTTYM